MTLKTSGLIFSIAAISAIAAIHAQSPQPPRLNWYRCNTHTHTTARPNSDANGTPDFVARWYKSHGYQCVVITDHEYLTDVDPLNRDHGADSTFLAISGQEVTQIWNAFPSLNNLGGVDDAGNVTPSTEALWDDLLTRGRIVWGAASDDVHEYYKLDDPTAPVPGKGWIVVRAPSLTREHVMEALRTGRFYASTGVTLDSYEADDREVAMTFVPPAAWNSTIKSPTRYVTRFIGEQGRVLAEVHGTSPRYRFTGGERYVRAAITDSDGRRAWTQPVFRDARAESERTRAESERAPAGSGVNLADATSRLRTPRN